MPSTTAKIEIGQPRVFTAGAVAQSGGFGIGYASVAVAGVLVAGIAAALLTGARRVARVTA